MEDKTVEEIEEREALSKFAELRFEEEDDDFKFLGPMTLDEFRDWMEEL